MELDVTLLASRILRWLLQFLKNICIPAFVQAVEDDMTFIQSSMKPIYISVSSRL
jgi:hypothetical protein